MQQRIEGLERQSEIDQSLIAELQAQHVIDQDSITNLTEALRTSRRIGAAVGTVMQATRTTEAQAFDLLREISQVTNRKLREVADAIVTIGGVTAPDQAFNLVADQTLHVTTIGGRPVLICR